MGNGRFWGRRGAGPEACHGGGLCVGPRCLGALQGVFHGRAAHELACLPEWVPGGAGGSVQ